jgi:hypothetical protein
MASFDALRKVILGARCWWIRVRCSANHAKHSKPRYQMPEGRWSIEAGGKGHGIDASEMMKE